MKVIRDIESWQAYRNALPAHTTIGLVPTMGCLHEGHMTLVNRARQENDLSILTIFVNPTQFNDPADYARYPKTEEADLQMAEKYGVDCVFMPSRADMYPSEHSISCSTKQPISQVMEGKYRPGHFDGMLTIVLKLFILTRPTRAYFGEKDYQQCRLVESLVENFLLPMTIVPCPTIREPQSALPKSSRNTLLNAQERQQADYFANVFAETQAHNIPESIQQLEAAGLVVEYIETCGDRILAAVKAGRIRLIDNHVLAEQTAEVETR
jgi:pantoate--beta-alanine ligase